MLNKYASVSAQIMIESIDSYVSTRFVVSAITISIHSVSGHHRHHGHHSL